MEQTIPLPKARQTVRITEHGGYNWRCASSRTSGNGYDCWANSIEAVTGGHCPVMHDGKHACGRPRTDGQVVECAPKVIEGRVTRIRTSVTGVPLVYVKVEGERLAESIAWTAAVLACEVQR